MQNTMDQSKPKTNWQWSGSDKTDKGFPEDTSAGQRKSARKELLPQDPGRPVSDEALREYCDRNYHQILPIIAEKVHQEKVQQEKLKAVKARLNFEEASHQSKSGTPVRRRGPKERLGPKYARSRSGSLEPKHGRSESPRKKGPKRKAVFKRLEREPTESASRDVITKRASSSRTGVLWDVKKYNVNLPDHARGITNHVLIMDPNDKIPKSVDEIMRVTTTFLRGEVTASDRERKKSFSSWKQQEDNQKQHFKKGGFRNQQNSERKQDRFTLLTKNPKEIFALDKGKFKAPPPMTTPVEKQNHAKFYEFHGEVGHNTDECMHLRKQIKEMLKAGKLSHLIKELKQNNEKELPKVTKKEETSGKDKALAIIIVQPWERVARQRITQSFSLNP
ncbi:hypothetical protein Tco_0826902 [Tanacetum coccineum]